MADIEIQAIPPREQYTVVAPTQSIFIYPFPIFEAEDITVYLTPNGNVASDTVDILLLTIDYDVTGVGAETGGFIVLTAAAVTGDKITVERKRIVKRLTDFQPGNFTEAELNDQLDVLTMYLQETDSDADALTPKYQHSDTVEPGQVILPQLGPGQVWKSNLLGTGIIAQDFTTTDLNTLRTDLANETQFNDGALLVGYFDVPFLVGSTTVHLALTKNSTEIKTNTTTISANFITLQNEINAIKDRESSLGVLLGGGFSENPYQEGTSFTNIVNDEYVADGWKILTTLATGKINCNRDTGNNNTLGGVYSNVFMSLACTTAQVSIGAAEYIALMQPVEGTYAQSLYLKNMLYSLNVDSLSADTYCIAITNKARTESYVTEINVTVGWTRLSNQVDAFLSAAAWSTDATVGLEFWIVLAAGANYQATAGTWQAGFFLATANQSNFVDAITKRLYLDLIKLEDVIETDFIYRGVEETLALAQRYFEKSYDVGTAPGSVSDEGRAHFGVYVSPTTLEFHFYDVFAVRKRDVPVMVWYSTFDGAIDRVYDNGVGNIIISAYGDGGLRTTGKAIGAATVNDGKDVYGQWTADARL